jgi:hypothetical protein
MRHILSERGNLERFGVELDRSRSRQKKHRALHIYPHRPGQQLHYSH